MKPYYEAGGITIYHADCRDVLPALAAAPDFMVTDPPYGISWSKGLNRAASSRAHSGIVGDADTSARDEVVEWWGQRPAVVFGSLTKAPPPNLIQALVWRKPNDSGVVGCVTGFRRDVDAVYLCGAGFPRRGPEWSSVLVSAIPNIGSPSSPAGETGHPHAKPVDLMAQLNALVDGVILDPFMGAGATLRAAKDYGRRAIGVEVEERYCEAAAKRLGQEVLAI